MLRIPFVVSLSNHEGNRMGRMLIGIGLLLTIVGGVFLLVERIPGIGRLPGDIVIERKNFTVYFPLATSILVSAILSILFWLFRR